MKMREFSYYNCDCNSFPYDELFKIWFRPITNLEDATTFLKTFVRTSIRVFSQICQIDARNVDEDVGQVTNSCTNVWNCKNISEDYQQLIFGSRELLVSLVDQSIS